MFLSLFVLAKTGVPRFNRVAEAWREAGGPLEAAALGDECLLLNKPLDKRFTWGYMTSRRWYCEQAGGYGRKDCGRKACRK